MIFLRLLIFGSIMFRSFWSKQFYNKPYARKVFEYKTKRTYYLFYNG